MPTFVLTIFAGLALIGMPLAFALGLTALLGFYKIGNTAYLTMIPNQFFSSMDSYTFLALPFFLLAGDIMNKIGLTERLVHFSNLFFGRLRGGLAQVNIVTSIIFGGISGAASLTPLLLDQSLYPIWLKRAMTSHFPPPSRLLHQSFLRSSRQVSSW